MTTPDSFDDMSFGAAAQVQAFVKEAKPPVFFVLVTTDGHRTGVTSNGTPALIAMALADALKQVGDTVEAPPPATTH